MDNDQQPEKFDIEWELNCDAQQARDLLAASVESFIRPWFVTKTNIKGFVLKDKFYIWPNTVFSSPSKIMISGRICTNGTTSTLTAKARLLPPYNIFTSSPALNWASGILMFVSWTCLAIGMFAGVEWLLNIAVPVFVVTCLFNLIQLVKFVQKPELVDTVNIVHGIFKEHIVEKGSVS